MYKVVKLDDFVTGVDTDREGAHVKAAPQRSEQSTDSMLKLKAANFQKLRQKEKEFEGRSQELDLELLRIGERERELERRKEELESEREEIETLRKKLLESIEILEKQRQEILEAHEDQLLQLCVKICHKVTGVILKKPDIFYTLLRTLLIKVPSNEDIKVSLNRKDHEYCAQVFSQKPESNIRLVLDENMDEGDIRIDYTFGSIDARLETVFEDILNQVCSKKK